MIGALANQTCPKGCIRESETETEGNWVVREETLSSSQSTEIEKQSHGAVGFPQCESNSPDTSTIVMPPKK